MGLSECRLAWRLRKGDRDACGELIARHHRSVYRYLLRLVRDPAAAEDLVQNTYAKAWRNASTLRRWLSLRAWLLTIARNEFLQWIRARRPEEPLAEDRPEAQAPEPNGEALVLAGERDRRLHLLVSQLEASLQEAVALHYFHELTLRETAHVLAVPTGTVKSRLNRALGELRDRLAEREIGHDDEA